jgi:hypothetical protein
MDDNQLKIDWKKVFGILLMLVGAAGSAAALLYIWMIQMMLRYARRDLMEGAWVFAICVAGLLVSILVGYIGVRVHRQPRP